MTRAMMETVSKQQQFEDYIDLFYRPGDFIEFRTIKNGEEHPPC